MKVTGHGIRVPHFADDIMAQCKCGQHCNATNEEGKTRINTTVNVFSTVNLDN